MPNSPYLYVTTHGRYIPLRSYKIKTLPLILTLSTLLLLAGCATPNHNLYYWGEYEQIIHDDYITPGSLDTLSQIQKLNVDIQQSENNGKKVAPGIYAHLGFLYAIQGNIADSQSAFLEEKARFPEATIFIDGMMQRAKNNKAN